MVRKEELSSPLGQDALSHEWLSYLLYAFPAQAQNATCGTTVASQTMVSFVTETSDRQSVAAFPQKGPPLPAGGQHLEPGPSSSAALGVSTANHLSPPIPIFCILNPCTH
ncbi:hypothetical protein QTP86_009967 [Hemibagrus guttatus]|nr:hypothetical protein QTP86_009967 [Hemibagrus guttatus]